MRLPAPILHLLHLLFAAALLLAPPASAVTILPGGGDGIPGGDAQELSADVREGVRLYGLGLYTQAFKKFSSASAGGDREAYKVLGVMHRDGVGTAQNYQLAKDCFAEASGQGDAYSRQELALLGFVVPEDPEEFTAARQQLEQLATEGNARAQLHLGVASLEGYGTTADAARGIRYLSDAATGEAATNAQAALTLGLLYRDGKSNPEVAADPGLAEDWLKAAAELEDISAMGELGKFYVDPAHGKQDFARARKWFSRLERTGVPVGSFYMGQMSENGWGVDIDLAGALRYYRKAADGKLPQALFKLAQFHERGLGRAEQDLPQAEAFYRKGAQLGHPVCMYNLSGLLDEKQGNDPSRDAEVLNWLLLAANAGLHEAEFKIGARYQLGRGVTQDFVAAAAWFDRASRAGHALAQLHLGEMYENGIGLARNYQSARQLFKLSAANGNLRGQVKYAMALAKGIGGDQDLVTAYLYAQASAEAAPDDQLAIQVRDAVKQAMTPEQLAAAEKKLAALNQPAAAGGAAPTPPAATQE